MSAIQHRSLAIIAAVVALQAASLAGAQFTPLVINEIDYDQPGAVDNAEFIEIKNVGCAPIDLSPYRLQLINGAGPIPTVYLQILLPSVVLVPGDYFVACGNAGLTPNCDLDVSLNENVIQNGAPDAIILINIDTGSIADTVSYEGSVPGYTETTGDSGDSGSIFDWGMGRSPDGLDTNHNQNDFNPMNITPGAANADGLVGICVGDINGDGTVNVDDLLAVINAWGPCANPNKCPADIAPPGGCGDDVVNVDDLLAVINAWGPCP
jgi:hypothetical protein